MRHHVHGANAQHGPIHVVTMKHMVHIVILVLPVKENFLLTVFLQVVADSHQEAGSTTRGITNDLICFGLHQIHHHANDMPGGAKLAVDTRCGNLGQKVFIYIAAGIRRFELGHLLVDAIHCCHDLIQHQWCRHFEDGITHVPGIGALLVTMKFFDEREHPFLHGAVHLSGRKVVKHTPLKLAAVNGTVTHLHLFGKNTLIR